MISSSVLSLFLTLTLSLVFPSYILSQPSVTTPYGTYIGVSSSSSDQFLGIPYAQSPTGHLRFSAPILPELSSSPIEVTSFAPGCIQHCSLPPGGCPETQSEDCLSLNIFVPSSHSNYHKKHPSHHGSDNKNSDSHRVSLPSLPVLFFIPGGNFHQGTAGCPLYNASSFVNIHNVIVVTINYRLGAFGFYWDDASIPANLGLLDQQLAMKFIFENIEYFGGNPQQITIQGQSAGACSVASHLQNPTSLQYINGAIMESLPAGIPLRLPTEMRILNNAFAKGIGCHYNDSECVRNADADVILSVQTKLSTAIQYVNDTHFFELFQPWEPTISTTSDNAFYIPHFIPDFFQMVSEGKYEIPVPVILGTTSEEAYVFVWQVFDKNISSLEAAAVETFVYGLHNYVEYLDHIYPLDILQGSHTFDGRLQMSQLVTDGIFTCPSRQAANDIISSPQFNNSHNVYLYVFSYVAEQGSAGWGPNYTECWERVCHGSELPFVFHSANALGYPLSPAEDHFSVQLGTYWSNFAKSGNPNLPVVVDVSWSPYSGVGSGNDILNMTIPIGMEQNYKEKECGDWDEMGYQFEENVMGMGMRMGEKEMEENIVKQLEIKRGGKGKI